MNEPGRICAFYSHGPHFLRLLRFLRGQYPSAHLTALVPPNYPQSYILGHADAVEVTERTQYGWRDLGAMRRLVANVRKGNYDVFAVMFDSPRLRLLSALTRTPERRCYTVDGRYVPLRLSFGRAALGALGRQICGHFTYARVWLVVHFMHVERRGHNE